MASPSPSPPVEERLAIGSVLDSRYRIDGLVGFGGMGSVYRCEHIGIGRPVAIKVLHANFLGNREASLRFQREAIASGRLDHPNIVGVTDFGLLDDGGCYLVMELLEGEPLGERLARERLPWRDAIEILRGVLRGLRHAHDRNVVHRDIKPDNVFLAVKDGDPITKILDFGIAKLLAGDTVAPGATRANITVGTPAYLSPEQAVGNAISPASDLYSTTVLLFEMLIGSPPFDDDDPMAVLGAHVGRKPPTLAEAAPELELPAELEDIVARGLAKTPADRFTSANEYLVALGHLLPAHPFESGRGATGRTGSVAALPEADPTLPRGDATTVTPPPTLMVPHRPASASELGEPIPRTWITGGAALLGSLLVIALVVAVASRGGAKAAGAAATPPPAVALDAETRALIEEGRLSRDRRLNDALAVIENGKEDCKLREAALAELLTLNHPRARKSLEQLRERIGGAKSTACVAQELNDAIKKLAAAAATPATKSEPKSQ
jgi:eukaryotic-like serine/threonine-protein kinase